MAPSTSTALEPAPGSSQHPPHPLPHAHRPSGHPHPPVHPHSSRGSVTSPHASRAASTPANTVAGYTVTSVASSFARRRVDGGGGGS